MHQLGLNIILTADASASAHSPLCSTRVAAWLATRLLEHAVSYETHGPTSPSAKDRRPETTEHAAAATAYTLVPAGLLAQRILPQRHMLLPAGLRGRRLLNRRVPQPVQPPRPLRAGELLLRAGVDGLLLRGAHLPARLLGQRLLLQRQLRLRRGLRGARLRHLDRADQARLPLRLRADVRRETDLRCSVGLGRTKLLSMLATKRAKPDGMHRCHGAEAERELLDSARVEAIRGAGLTGLPPATRAALVSARPTPATHQTVAR